MNPGRCKKCGSEIIWVPNPNGGWLRPMERFDARLDTATYDQFHGRQVYLALDGTISQIRASSLLVWHECPPEQVEEEIPVIGDQVLVQGTGQVLTVEELDQLVRERAIEMTAVRQEIDEQEAQEIIERRREAQRLRDEQEAQARAERARQKGLRDQHPFTRVPCPYCSAEVGEPCQNQGPGVKVAGSPGHDTLYTRNAHQERQDFAYGSGLVEDPAPYSGPVRPTRRAADSDLYAWLRLNLGIWSEVRTTTSDADVNLFGNEDEASGEAGTGN